MKVVAICIALAASAQAFAPSLSAVKPTALRMSELPIGAAPLGGKSSIVIGENWWNKLTTEYGSADTGTFLRAAELKHGRSAMVATVGFAFEKLGITFDKISPHEYLSVTQNIKFADLAALTPIEAVQKIPAEGVAQIFMTIAAIEIYELTHRDGAIVNDARIAPGWEAGGLTGDIGWNPLGVKVTDRRRLVEIQNGRAAMFAITAWVMHDYLPGSVPIPLPW
jgi:hypothetical protein